MDFGTFHLFETRPGRSDQQAISEQLDLMQAAEGLGFTSVWAAEHHFGDYGICPSAQLALAAVARTTKTLRLGTGIVVLPFHNPIRVAEELAFVDAISNGRLDVGLGRGYRAKEMRGFGVDSSETREIFRESIDVILQAWTQDRVNFSGKYFQIEDLELRPKPVQQPHPRTWVGSLSPETFELVGRLGANLLFTPRFTPEEDVPAEIENYRRAVRAAGQDPSTKRVGALRFIYVSDSTEQARREFREPSEWFHGEASRQNAPQSGDRVADYQRQYIRERGYDFDERLASGGVIAGDPDHVIEQLEKMQETWQLTDLIMWTRVGGLETSKVLHSMELTSRYIIPHFKQDSSSAALQEIPTAAAANR